MKGYWSSTRVVGQQCQVSQLGFNNWSKLSTPLHTFSSILFAQILYVALFIRSEFKLILETWRQACFSSRRKVQTLTWTLKGKMQTVAWLPGASSTMPTQPPDTLSHAGTVASRSSEESKFAHVVCILEPRAGFYRCCARYGITILIIGREIINMSGWSAQQCNETSV